MAAISIKNDNIRETLYYLATIKTILEKELSQAKNNKSYIDKIVPEYLINLFSKKQNDTNRFIDNLNNSFEEFAIVMLIATFEKIVFSKYSTTYGKLRSIVRDHSSKPMDYFDAKERLINSSYDKLSQIMNLIDGLIDKSLFIKLKQIKDQRDYIAHGKRIPKPQNIDLKLEEIATVLDSALFEISK